MPPSSKGTPTPKSKPAQRKTLRKPASSKRKRKQRKLNLPWWSVAAAIAAVVLAVSLPYWIATADHSVGAPVPEGGYRHYAVDLSHHNKDIQWDSLRIVIDRQGRTSKDILRSREILPVSQVFLKATEGESMKDDRFDEYWAQAARVGIPRGAYHFFRTSKDPLLQAQNFISAVTLTHADLPPVLDVETIHSGCTPEELNRKALTWLKTVEAHYGRKPMVYTNDKFALDILSEDITGHYPLWIARYNSAPPRTSGWSRWQFSDKAVVYGIRGYVDLSVIQK